MNTGENKPYESDNTDDSMLEKVGRWASTWYNWFGEWSKRAWLVAHYVDV